MKCTNCGADIPEGSQFCGQCGQKVAPIKQETAENAFAYLCPICKTPNPNHVKYCVSCGHWMLDSKFEAIPLTEKQYYAYVQKRNKVKVPLRKANVIISVIIYALYAILLIVIPLDFKIFLGLILLVYGIINICIPIRRMLISKRWVGIIIAAFAFVLTVSMLANYSPKAVQTSAQQTSSISVDQFKAQSAPISYSDLAHSTEQYINKKVAISGQVVQVQESGASVVLRVNMTKDQYGVYSDTIWIDYTIRPGNGHIVENDIVNIWGTVSGRKTYTTVLGASQTIPEINAVDIEENK